MIFDEVFINERFDILNHESENRHKIIIAVIYEFKDYRLYFSF